MSTKNTVNPREYCVLAGADSSEECDEEAVTTIVSTLTGGSGCQYRSAARKSVRKSGAVLG
jgi:hypothetical protein